MSLPNNIPSHLKIRILYSDDNIVVIDKPCDLRSVPGHANPPPAGKEGPQSGAATATEEGGDVAPQSHRRTAQEAWIQAIQLMSADKDSNRTCGTQVGNKETASMEDAASAEIIYNLATTSADPSCVPRKLETFIKYCHRNSKRLLPSFPELQYQDGNKAASSCMLHRCEQHKEKRSKTESMSTKLRYIAHACYIKIQKKQRLLMNLPMATEDWESAVGQLSILGFGDYSHWVSSLSTENIGSYSKLHVVHRLDCQVSEI